MILTTIPNFNNQTVALNTLIQDLHHVEGKHTHVVLKIIHDLQNQSITTSILTQDLHQVQSKDTQRFLIFILHNNMKLQHPMPWYFITKCQNSKCFTTETWNAQTEDFRSAYLSKNRPATSASSHTNFLSSRLSLSTSP